MSEDNEHWYHDCSDDSIILEFDLRNPDKTDHWFNNDGEELTIKINKGSDLYIKLAKIFWRSGWCGTNPLIK